MRRTELFGESQEGEEREHPVVEVDRGCVLVVEDDDRVRELMALLMRSEGYEVIELGDGLEALQYMAAATVYRREMRPPDLVVADIQMPSFTGFDLLMGMREYRCRPPVMLVTGTVDEEVRDEARRLGAACVMQKPIDIDAFIDAVAVSMAESASREERRMVAPYLDA